MELLITVAILAIVMGGISTVVVSTARVEQYEGTLQSVVRDGRVSLQRIRGELRSARRVYEDSGPSNLRFWVDTNQDQVPSPDEEICYLVTPLPGATSQWQITRWDLATDASNCATGSSPPSGATRMTVARTLVDAEPFTYEPIPAGPTDPPTREVDVELALEVVGRRNLGVTTVEGSIRLRNVP